MAPRTVVHTTPTEHLRSTEADESKAFFMASRHVAPVGNVVAGLVALAMVWGHVPHGRLLVWFGAVVGVALLQARDALDPERFVEDPTPRGIVDTNLLAGVVWGVIPFLDLVAFMEDEIFRWVYLVFAFAIAAGAMGGLSTLTGVAIRVQVPLLGLSAVALVVAGEPAIAVGVVVFLALMTSDIRGTSEVLQGLVSVRVASAERAFDAEVEARHDSLTGVLNRVGVFERMERLRGREPLVAMFVDLDFFKEVNDRLGHEAGDVVLVEVVRRIRSALRPDDLVARLGGDEFLVVIERGEVDLDAITQRILDAVERPIRIGDDQAAISASIGLTEVADGEWTTTQILREADHALYEAKRAGRQRIVWFDDRLADDLEQRTALEQGLRSALESGAIRPVAQPVFHMRTGEIAWVEVTPHWELPAGNHVPPSVFVPLAEELGLVESLTRSILDQGATARRRWRSHPALASASLSVRVVASHLMRGRLADDIGSLCIAHGLGPGELQLVLTDTAEIADPLHAAGAIESMRSMGVGFVLGEFGGGTSTLGDLLQLPIDVVTVHPRLLRQAPNDERVVRLLAAFDHVAGTLGLQVGADGVDTLAQLDIVRSLGLPYAQGRALCPPVPLEELEGCDPAVLVGAWGLDPERNPGSNG